jgi:hypothetical protein
MNPLQSRKKMLVAESELNRAQLVQDWLTMAGEVHALTSQARTITSIASAAASLVTGLLSFRHAKKPATADEKPSWFKTILKGAGLVSTAWQAFRPPNCDEAEL